MNHKDKVKAIIDRQIRDIVLYNANGKIPFFSINKIEVSNDLSFASVYVSFLNQKDQNKSFEKLVKMAPYFRHELAQKIDTYKTPVIKFIFDERFIIDERVDQLLKEDQKQLDKIQNKSKKYTKKKTTSSRA